MLQVHSSYRLANFGGNSFAMASSVFWVTRPIYFIRVFLDTVCRLQYFLDTVCRLQYFLVISLSTNAKGLRSTQTHSSHPRMFPAFLFTNGTPQLSRVRSFSSKFLFSTSFWTLRWVYKLFQPVPGLSFSSFPQTQAHVSGSPFGEEFATVIL